MPLRPCLGGCGALVDGTRCTRCRSAKNRERDQARGSRQQRGYDAEFEQAKQDPAYVNATHCAQCGKTFTVSNPKTAGHKHPLRNGARPPGPVQIEAQCQDCNYGWRRTGL